MFDDLMRIQGRLTARPDQALGLDQGNLREGPELLAYGADGLLFVPTRAGRRARLPLLVMLHGATHSAADSMLIVQPAADDRGFIVFAPKSQDRTWDFIRRGFGPDFVAINETLEDLFDSYPIDPANIAIGGFSDGASYALTLGLLNGDLFRNVLAFSPGFSAADQIVGRPNVYISHGRRDPVLPYERCGAALARNLAEQGLDVRFDPFDGGHSVPFSCAAAAADWWLRS